MTFTESVRGSSSEQLGGNNNLNTNSDDGDDKSSCEDGTHLDSASLFSNGLAQPQSIISRNLVYHSTIVESLSLANLVSMGSVSVVPNV